MSMLVPSIMLMYLLFLVGIVVFIVIWLKYKVIDITTKKEHHYFEEPRCIILQSALYNSTEIEIDAILTYLVGLSGRRGVPAFFIFYNYS